MAEGITSLKEPRFLVRPLREVQEMSIGVDLQRRVWGYNESDIVPDEMFVVAKESGGQVFGAFHQNQPVGFALAFAGTQHGMVYLHSHMVGVVPEYQNCGVGRLLKLAQRDNAIARGISLIDWTFDPLQLKNAHFNLARLGAIVRRYISNCYGRTSSPLHAGLPTDRLVAEWWVQSDRVRALLSGKTNVPGPECLRISIPVEIRELCANNLPEAEKVQLCVREEFERHIAAGRTAVGFEFSGEQGSYLMKEHKE